MINQEKFLHRVSRAALGVQLLTVPVAAESSYQVIKNLNDEIHEHDSYKKLEARQKTQESIGESMMKNGLMAVTGIGALTLIYLKREYRQPQEAAEAPPEIQAKNSENLPEIKLLVLHDYQEESDQAQLEKPRRTIFARCIFPQTDILYTQTLQANNIYNNSTGNNPARITTEVPS